MYGWLRPLLFCLQTEFSHHLTLNTLDMLDSILPSRPIPNVAPVTLMGLSFPNRIGLAAGLDKNGEHIDALARLGFGFIEVGTVTPRAQSGNPKPRLFRLSQAKAIINRMGFNNKGVDYLCQHVTQKQYKGIVGINIGKNAKTPLNKAHADYLMCLKQAYIHADYITVNISSPNTAQLRELQNDALLASLLEILKEGQLRLALQTQRYVPLVLKIAPDLMFDQIVNIAQLLLRYEIDGVIATNTMLDKQAVAHLPHGLEQGGLSGAPLTKLSTDVIRILGKELKGRIPIIGVGGILSVQDAQDKINAGASLLQLYTGLIYKGPSLVTDCLKTLKFSNMPALL